MTQFRPSRSPFARARRMTSFRSRTRDFEERGQKWVLIRYTQICKLGYTHAMRARDRDNRIDKQGLKQSVAQCP